VVGGAYLLSGNAGDLCRASFVLSRASLSSRGGRPLPFLPGASKKRSEKLLRDRAKIGGRRPKTKKEIHEEKRKDYRRIDPLSLLSLQCDTICPKRGGAYTRKCHLGKVIFFPRLANRVPDNTRTVALPARKVEGPLGHIALCTSLPARSSGYPLSPCILFLSLRTRTPFLPSRSHDGVSRVAPMKRMIVNQRDRLAENGGGEGCPRRLKLETLTSSLFPC